MNVSEVRIFLNQMNETTSLIFLNWLVVLSKLCRVLGDKCVCRAGGLTEYSEAGAKSHTLLPKFAPIPALHLLSNLARFYIVQFCIF